MALLADSLYSANGWKKCMALRAEVLRVLDENNELEHQRDSLARQVVAQNERPEVQESLVRDLLGYVRPDDQILQVPMDRP